MRKLLVLLLLACAVVRAEDPGMLPIETQVQKATASGRVTIVHFWAPWCPNCKAELADGKWQSFIEKNPDVDFIFITAWNPADGHELLAKNGVGTQKNFTLLLHPNGSKKRGEKVTSFLGLPLSWIPTTWVYKDGKMRYALNYGELHFDMLQQLIKDSSDAWEH
jgi:thiol-disulfide isomerase/thioredoxin